MSLSGLDLVGVGRLNRSSVYLPFIDCNADVEIDTRSSVVVVAVPRLDTELNKGKR